MKSFLLKSIFQICFYAWILVQSSRPTLATEDEFDFEKEIWPIFQARCNDCHGADVQEGQLRLDAKTAFRSGGVSGNLIDSKQTDKSLLLTRILGHGDLDRMPLDDDPLSAKEIAKIRKWLEAGAKWPDHVGARVANKKKHWAYSKPTRPVPPALKENWSLNEIDRFVLKRMKDRGLGPSPPAAKGKLLRRLYFDLVGFPPTLEELEEFSKNDSPTAYEDTVDRLVASSAFGEKWSRSWLDLARYADTNGFQADQFRSVWPYRDWVIRAINNDMPFDQFTIEQLAGDLLPNATLDQKIATGFHRLTTCNVEAGVDPEQNRVNQVIDRINTTGTVWFGTTFECMQCHNHKYDPFTQREYYEMFAFFNNTPLEVKDSGNDIQYEFFGPKMDLPLDADKQIQLKAIEKTITSIQTRIADREKALSSKFEKWLAEQRSGLSKQEKWIVLKIDRFESQGGAGHQILKDQSILLKGKNPDKDSYIVDVSSDLPVINGFKFETLTHESLPSKGPGRHAVAGRPNFVVHEIVATLPSENNRQIEFVSAIADFVQKGFPANGPFDGNPKTAWAIAPKFSQNHSVSVLAKSPITLKQGSNNIRFRIDQNHGNGRNIGRLRISALVGSRSISELPPALKKLVRQKSKLKPAQKKQLETHFFAKDPAHKKLSNELVQAKKKREAIKPISTLVMVESKMRNNAVFKRGNFLDRGESVSPGTPSVLHQLKEKQRRNRLDFAKWVVDRDNPLTARVVVNRWWQEIFGRGIVSTSEDFGTQGEPPSHPDLLDWLATEFIDSGWSRKRIIKAIVLSQTYRQASSFEEQKIARDPNNLYLARAPRFRLSAELIRDNYLLVSRQLTQKIGGPPVFPPQPEGIWRHVGRNAPKYNTSKGTDRYRRGLYVFWRRSAPFPGFVNFDAPDRASCVVKRSTTNTPLQALTLLNDQGLFELSRLFAIELQSDPKPTAFKLDRAFTACTARKPNQKELSFLTNYVNSKIDYYKKNPAKARDVSGSEPNAIEIAAWVSVVQVLFNLDETITKD